MVEHARALARATELPVSMDLEDGYGPEPVDAARAITRAAEAGAVGGSIEDWDRSEFLHGPERAAERVAAAAEAARALDFPFTLRAVPRTTSGATRTSMTASGASWPMRRPAPTCCSHRESAPMTRSGRSAKR